MALATLPQLTSQKSWFQKLQQPLWLPIKTTEIIGKANSLWPEEGLFKHILVRRFRGFPYCQNCFTMLFQNEISQFYSYQLLILRCRICLLCFQCFLRHKSCPLPGFVLLQLTGWHWTNPVCYAFQQPLYQPENRSKLWHFHNTHICPHTRKNYPERLP